MIKLIIGLGNPTDQYLKTRHNAGFWLLDALAHRYQGIWKNEKKFHGDYAQIILNHQSIHLLKPYIFMNNSGRAVQAVAQFYQIELEQILVVHDELDLPEGCVRLKFDGGHGGHNGLRDIISACAGRNFYRLRLGIDRPSARHQVVDYVLKAPSKEGRNAIDGAIDEALAVLPVLIKDGAEKAMHQLHSRINP